MRLWSLHPGYLDAKGLVACWREALLAQAVLAGRTKGYTRHPQLERFRDTPEPLAAIGAYLAAIAEEATRRGYHFDATRILEPPVTAGDPPEHIPSQHGAVPSSQHGAVPSTPPSPTPTPTPTPVPTPASGGHPCLDVTTGQLALERRHLLAKLRRRSPSDVARLERVEADRVDPHPMFRVVEGGVAAWEREVVDRP